MPNYTYLSLLIGVVATLIGLVIVVLSLIFLRQKRANSIYTGIAFVLFGVAIIWFGLQGDATFHFKTNLTNKQFGLLLAIFVMSLFILRGVLDLRKGLMKSREDTLSGYSVYLNGFRIIVAAIILIASISLVILIFSYFGK
jgi:hypothetical protein